MHYIFEAIIVGIYSVFIYYVTNFFIEGRKLEYLQLFTVGFFKHYLSGFLQIHDFYCNYGYSCYENNDCKNGKCYSNKTHLFFESLFEGLLYLITGFILTEFAFYFSMYPKNIYLYFLIGFLLHISFEWLQIHKYFCKHTCTHNAQ